MSESELNEVSMITEDELLEKPSYKQATEEEIKAIVAIIEHIVKNLIDRPEDINITWETKDKCTYILLSVSPDDMGKVIGKQGRIAKAIRAIIKSAAIKQGNRYVLDIK